VEPVTPVIPGAEQLEAQVGAKQEEYVTLPAFQTEYSTISRWRLSDDERRHIASGGDLFIAQLNFGNLVQPVMPMALPEGDILQQVLACEDALTGGAKRL
jgi:hypothetical protein